MSTTADPLLETLVNDFGGNYVFALDLLEQYRQDRRSVDTTWRAYFDKALGLPPEAEQTPVTVIVNEAPKAAPAAAPGAGLQTLARQDVPVVAAGDPAPRRWRGFPSSPATSPSPSAAAPRASSRTWRPASDPDGHLAAHHPRQGSTRTAASSTSTARRRARARSPSRT